MKECFLNKTIKPQEMEEEIHVLHDIIIDLV